ncbi:hypothetical protein N8508_00050 [bacterium]|nr:hypothetical protein [bacterium]
MSNLIIPEIVIKEELDILIKNVYLNLKGLESTGSVIDAVDIDSGVTISVTQQGAVGTPEITDVTFPVGASLDGKSWHLNTTTKFYNVIYSITGSGVSVPSLIERVSIIVTIDGTETDIEVAQKTQAAIAAFSTAFTVPTTTTSTITITTIDTNAEKRSILYHLFGELKFDGMSYFRQAANIIKARYTSEQRRLNINLGYNPNREEFPQISILLPNEDNEPKYVGVVQGTINHRDGSFSDELNNTFATTYSLMITSDNQNEVIILYHLLKGVMLGGINQFRARGFENIYFSGRDITMDFDLDPMNLYHRTISMSFHYENEISDIINNEVISSINFNGTITDN